jgi:hypothetical protein
MKKLTALLCLTSSLALAPLASATVINGQIRNFDADNNGIANDLQIARIYFTVSAGTSLLIDSLVWESTGVDLNGDGEITGFDNYMRLFSGSTLLADNDDAPLGTDGSVHHYDSQINYTFASAGTYMVSVGQLWYSEAEALQGFQLDRPFYDYTGNGHDHGAWRLTFNVNAGSVSNINSTLAVGAGVPDGGNLLLLLGLSGVSLAGLRRFSRGAAQR